MGLSKTEEFTKTQNEIASLAKALGHPARIAILQYLAERKTCVCGDIVDELPLSQSTVSQHLKELKKVGLIKGDIEGPTVCYCVDVKGLAKARKVLNDILQDVHENCC
jgi:ArsR family transcriptional regulator